MVQRGSRQFTTPIHVDRLDSTGAARTLEPVLLGQGGDVNAKHDEGWLQRLIFNFPQSLPVRDIDPGFDPLVSVCIELPVSSGFLDNLFVTESGDIVVIECKLWRNPQARREVVAQIIDYAHSMASWSYEDLERAIRQAKSSDGQKISRSLFDYVAESTALTENQFIDAVSRNLRLGRMLLLIVGDGIREGTETLTEYLQLHAGFHFTLALVEMPVYRLPVEGYIIHPRILARTLNIERGIVRVSEGNVRIDPISSSHSEAPVMPRAIGLTEERLREAIASSIPGATDALDKFAALASDRGVFVEPGRQSLMIKWRAQDGASYSLGGITTSGEFISYSVNWSPNGLGRIDLAHEYLQGLADIVGGEVRKTPTPASWYVVKTGTVLPRAMDVLDRSDAWLKLIDSYAAKLRDAIAARQN